MDPLEDPKPKTPSNPNCITTGISKRFLTPCRRIGLSRSSKPRNNVLTDIHRPENQILSTSNEANLDLNATPTTKTSTSTEKDIICTTRHVTIPNDLNVPMRPELKDPGETSTEITLDTFKIGNNVDFLKDTPAAKKVVTEKAQTAIAKLDTSKKNEESRMTKITESEVKNEKTIKITNNKDNLPTQDRRVNSNENENGNKNNLFSKKQNLNIPRGKKREKILDRSDSDSDFETGPPIRIVTKAQVHHPPAKRRTIFNEKKICKLDATSSKLSNSRVTKTQKLTEIDAIAVYSDDSKYVKNYFKSTDQRNQKEYRYLSLSVVKDDSSSKAE